MVWTTRGWLGDAFLPSPPLHPTAVPPHLPHSSAPGPPVADITFSFPPATVGEDYSLGINIADPTTGATLDLSSYSGDFQVRQTSGSAILMEASTSNGQMALEATAPNCTISFRASQITQAGSPVGELKLIDGNGIVSKPVGGPLQINSTITP